MIIQKLVLVQHPPFHKTVHFGFKYSQCLINIAALLHDCVINYVTDSNYIDFLMEHGAKAASYCLTEIAAVLSTDCVLLLPV